MKNQTYIRQLFEKYLDGQCSASEAEELLRYLQESNDKDFVEELIESLQERTHTARLISEQQTDVILNQSYNHILGHIEAENEPVRSSRLLYAIVTVAASILVIAGAFLFYQYQTRYDLLTITAGYGEKKQITLPDRSKLWLNAGTTVRYPKNFKEDTRTIILDEGQAYFDVVHVKDRPFIVRLKDATVTVLGTSFEVKSYRNETQSVVSVYSGKVGVIPTGSKQQPIFLLPAQKLVINTSAATEQQQVTSPADIAAWKDDRIAFSEEEFGTIIRALERQYDIKIQVKKTELFRERITLRLEGQSLQNVMEALSFSNHFTYRYANDREIVIE